MKTWLKYGLIFGLTHLIIIGTYSIITLLTKTSGDFFMLIAYIELPIILISKKTSIVVSAPTLGSIQWFVIGSIIGLIIKKIKN